MMIKQIAQVEEFMKATGQEVRLKPTAKVDDKGQLKQMNLRMSLIQEELQETFDAWFEEDTISMADGLADTLYILLGTIIQFGFGDCIEEVFDEVHRSNMTKLGPGGKPKYREDGKILKGPNFEQPKLKEIINKYI